LKPGLMETTRISIPTFKSFTLTVERAQLPYISKVGGPAPCYAGRSIGEMNGSVNERMAGRHSLWGDSLL
jgi:hypothetical protein